MKKIKLLILAIFALSVALLLTGCGPTNQPPNASFSASPTSVETPLEVTLDASSSSDPDGSIVSFEWDFGDGTSSSGETTTHTYDSAGDYTVELTVTDDGGATDSATEVVSVSAPNKDPNSGFTASPTSGEAPLEVSFDASKSEDPDGTIASYSWDFGDGDTGTGETITHTYADVGDYTAELTVTDDDGAADKSTQSISVSSGNNPPTASFTADPTSGAAPLEVSFDASGSSDSDGSIDSYSWDFGDGNSGSGETVNHTYDSSGDYTVELTVTDDDGATDETSETIEVVSPPEPPE
mgnify:CR=1 FL=1